MSAKAHQPVGADPQPGDADNYFCHSPAIGITQKIEHERRHDRRQQHSTSGNGHRRHCERGESGQKHDPSCETPSAAYEKPVKPEQTTSSEKECEGKPVSAHSTEIVGGKD